VHSIFSKLLEYSELASKHLPPKPILSFNSDTIMEVQLKTTKILHQDHRSHMNDEDNNG
jgi:hypothetical protein